MRQSVSLAARPWSPESSQTGASASAAEREATAGRPRTARPMTPPVTKTQTISDSVQAVMVAAARKMDHSSQSRASVIRTSFQALRAMIAMTAAPIP